jgi:hypothetical protein
MSKRQCENELEEMTRQRDKWRDLAEKRTDQLKVATAEIAQLRDALAGQQDNAELLSGEAGIIPRLTTQRDNYRREAHALQRDIDSMMNKYGQLEVMLNPQRIANREELFEMSDEELERSGGVRFHTTTAPLQVAYMVVATSAEMEKPIWGQGTGLYIGSREDLGREIQRFQQLIWRAPMPEDMRGSSMEIYSITKDRQLKAIQALSLYVYDPSLREQFAEQFDHVFKIALEPLIPSYYVSAAREAFRKSVKSTYEKLAENRGFTLDFPKLPVGAKTKMESE